MIRGLSVVALAAIVSTPATAGDRPKPKPARVLQPSASSGTGPRGAPDAPRRSVHTTFVLPVLPGDLERTFTARRRLVDGPAEENRDAGSADAKSSLRFSAGAPLSEVTGEAGGSYAVRDYFAAQRKPRQRQTPLGAMFILRLDGEEESPSFSVGGGGVPAALWGVLPKN